MSKPPELFIFPTRLKKPLTTRGLYDAQLESVWTGEESEQWAAPCGEKNGFFVVDVDKKSGGLESAASINWGDTLKVNTPGGGYHVYYKYDEQKVALLKNGVGVLPGVDIRNNGGYVCLYAQVDYSAIGEIPVEVLSLLSTALKRSRKESVTNVHGEVGEGGRNAYLAKAAGRMQKVGVLTLSALKEVNEEKCAPPLDDGEVEQVFHSIKRYEPESTPDSDDEPRPRTVWVNEMVAPMLEFLRNKEMTRGEPTGIKALDDLLGGRRLGELTVTMAEAKTGKNTWWHMQQRFMLDRGIAIGYASRELSPETEVLPNLLTLKLGKNIYKNDVLEEEIYNAISGWKLAFSNGYGAYQGNELFEWLEECVKQGVKYFFLDHLGYMTVDSEDFKILAEFGRKLKTFTKTHQCSIDLIIQPKVRPTYKIGDKMQKADMDINMLRGGASLGQVLDSLITMDRLTDDDGNLTNVVKIDLKRARSKLSKTGTFFMQYNADSMVFTECGDPRDKEEAPADNSRGFPKRRENAQRPGVSPTRPATYGESKNGEFFDLKRMVDKMREAIKEKK